MAWYLSDIGNPFLLDGPFGTFMLGDPESIAPTLRSQSGVKDVDIVEFPTGKELWVVLREPINLDRLGAISDSMGYMVTKRGEWISKLPRSLAEMIWDGLTYVIIRHTHVPGKHESAARIMKDLATGNTIYHAIDNDGLTILQEYLKT